MEVHHTTHEWGGDGSLACTIAETVAAMEGTDSTEMKPIDTAVDTDALDRLFAPLEGSMRRNRDGRVQFTFDGYLVTVTSGGDVTVCRRSTAGTRDGVSDEATFEEALARLVREALANGVDVDGGWSCRDGVDGVDWGIEIYAVKRTDDDT